MNYYIVNSNNKLNPTHTDEKSMLEKEYVALYDKNSVRVNKFQQADMIFLFKNKIGIIAYGQVNGVSKYKNLKDGRKEGSQKFINLKILKEPLTTEKMKELCGNMALIQSAFHLNDKHGQILLKHLEINKPVHLRLVA